MRLGKAALSDRAPRSGARQAPASVAAGVGTAVGWVRGLPSLRDWWDAFQPPDNSHRLLYGLVATAVLSIICIAWLDRPVAEFFRDRTDTELHHLAQAVTPLGKGTWWAVFGGLILVVASSVARITHLQRLHDRFQLYAHRAAYFLIAFAVSGILINVLKVLFGRLRPNMYFWHDMYGFDPLSFGYATAAFPSGHAATIAVVTTALALMFRKWAPYLIVFMVIVASTRVIITAHFLGDVVAGIFVGVAVAVLTYRAYGRRFPL